MGIRVSKIVEDLKLEILLDGDMNKEIDVSEISRPGLQFAGYYDYFGYMRLQILGRAEFSYLETLNKNTRIERMKKFFKYDIPCVIISRSIIPHKELIEEAKNKNVSILRSNKSTTKLINILMNYLDRELALSTTLHGVLLDVYGVGILITGESGIGKSEIALELIKRGHRLVTDDAVDVRNIDGILYGTCPYITYGMLEVRGLGIIDVSALYGLSSIVNEKVMELVVDFKPWNEQTTFERLGEEFETIDILGVKMKKIIIPVRPGRNLAVIIEAAAANYRYGLVSKVSSIDIINKRIFDMNNNDR